MPEDLTHIKDVILLEALPDVGFEGWGVRALEDAAVRAGFERAMVDAAFPGEVKCAVDHFSDWADRQMLVALESTNIEALRVRDRIRQAVLARLEVMAPHKEAVRQTMAYWTLPPRGAGAASALWRTADRMWIRAGDDAAGYNHYTKRGLLTGVLGSTTLAWMNDDDPDMQVTRTFLDRRIENVMQLGKALGKFSRKKRDRY